MGGIIWLASYPKSGSTWTRAFLCNLLVESDKPADINQLSNFCFNEDQISLYRRLTESSLKNLSPEEIAALRPKVHEMITGLRAGSIFVKTHNFLGRVMGIPLINMQFTAGAVYVVRNPLDVTISFASHFGLTIDQAIEVMNDPRGGTPTTDVAVRQVFNTWSANVASWTMEAQPRLHVMRYEDMIADTSKTFAKLADFLRISVSNERLVKAIEYSSFESLRQQEQKKGFAERKRSTPFFRKGKSEQWKSCLSDDQIGRIIQQHSRQMRRFGYLPEGY